MVTITCQGIDDQVSLVVRASRPQVLVLRTLGNDMINMQQLGWRQQLGGQGIHDHHRFLRSAAAWLELDLR